jgi:hypothetical protein
VTCRRAGPNLFVVSYVLAALNLVRNSHTYFANPTNFVSVQANLEKTIFLVPLLGDQMVYD